nr:MAG TPA: PROTEIN/RNA Complex, archaeal, ribosomal, 50S, protein.0A [Caudoviricetes sp.]
MEVADSMNFCVCCGAIIPEGRQVCPICERKWPEF